eukprot:TRINITY_DN429_c1_g2_i1.p1 TRINITY_DN429_c1_g2~~TRINITY_DN429_c1_g2_i1.p1  ORF type:complete len:104 (-),score=15.84 TRINITY_DN429_c1_g2_i1:86-397(-)
MIEPLRADLLFVVAVTWILSHISAVRTVKPQMLKLLLIHTRNKEMVECSASGNFETFLTIRSLHLTSVVEASFESPAASRCQSKKCSDPERKLRALATQPDQE